MTDTDIDKLADAVAERIAARLEQVPGPYLSPKRVADILDVSERTVRELVGDGRLPSVKVGGARRVEAAALRAYVEQRHADD